MWRRWRRRRDSSRWGRHGFPVNSSASNRKRMSDGLAWLSCLPASWQRRLFTQWGLSGEAANTVKLSYFRRGIPKLFVACRGESLRSIAFPATYRRLWLSTCAVEIAVRTVSDFITRYALPEQVCYFVCYDEETARLRKIIYSARRRPPDKTRPERAVVLLARAIRSAAFPRWITV